MKGTFMSKKIKFLLTISIILNFLFVGLLIGSYSKFFFHHWGMKHHFSEVAEKLPPEKQELVKKKMNELRNTHKEKKREIRKTRKEIAEILKAPEFNQQLYDQKISEMHNLYRGKAVYMAETIKELAVQLTPEERKALADMIEKKHKRKYWRERHRD